MVRKLLTAEEALEYMNSLSDEELDDPEMIIIPPEADAVSDEEEIDDSVTNRNIEETCGDPKIQDTAGTIEVLSVKKPILIQKHLNEKNVSRNFCFHQVHFLLKIIIIL